MASSQDLAALHPPGRWGGHRQISPDSRYIVCGGGPGPDHGVYLAEWPVWLPPQTQEQP